MSDPEQFKYDVRVRDRMLHKGSIDEGEVKRHLDALQDLEAVCEIMTLQQPALAHAETPSPAAAVEAPIAVGEPMAAPPEPPLAAPPPPPAPPPVQAAASPTAEVDSADDDGWGS